MITERMNITVDYKKAKLPLGTPADFMPKKDDFQPTLVSYLHADWLDTAVHSPRKAIVVCPGGGYHFVSAREAEPIAAEYFAAGFQVFVLYYSVAPNVFPASLMELATAVKLVRDRAKEWNILPDKIAVCGFSAGGHLAASLATMWQEPFLSESVGAPGEDFRPNGSILAYPVITSGEHAHRGSFDNLLRDLPEALLTYTSLENRATENVPPTFLWSTWTDQLVPIENSLLYATALRKAGVSMELHIFKEGRHGLSLANDQTSERVLSPTALDPKTYPFIIPHVAEWMHLSKDWMKLL